MKTNQILLTGDTHGDFSRIALFCDKIRTKREDILIILGDVGFNFWGNERDVYNKTFAASLPITLFCMQGNHEQRPEHFDSYQMTEWHGGKVWVEPEYPNIIFAKDGEVYGFDGKKAIVIGGAYSVDKPYRLARGFGWWADEQPSESIKAFVEEQLQKESWKVDYVLTHTVPLKCEPVEVFLGGIINPKWINRQNSGSIR